MIEMEMIFVLLMSGMVGYFKKVFLFNLCFILPDNIVL